MINFFYSDSKTYSPVHWNVGAFLADFLAQDSISIDNPLFVECLKNGLQFDQIITKLLKAKNAAVWFSWVSDVICTL